MTLQTPDGVLTSRNDIPNILLVVFTWLLWTGTQVFAGCTVPNPRYCDADKPCPEGKHCDMSENRCVDDVCGNNALEPSEICDGDEFGGDTCGDHDFAGGQLRCTEQCELDFRDCTQCGNGVMEDAEACDGTDFSDQTCQTVMGRQEGQLVCTDQCQMDTSNCFTCGDGLVEAGEQCDGANLGAHTCATLGHNGGNLACNLDCTVGESGCFDCGDDLCETTKGEDVQSCSHDCAWTLVSGSASHTCAIKESRSLRCWGSNEYGQLGDGLTHQSCGTSPFDCSPMAVSVPGMTDVVSVSSSHAFHACALKSDGTAWCWGDNQAGQLGDGTTNSHNTPVQVSGLSGVSVLSAGGLHGCAVSGGTAWCWGNNGLGQLGDGNYGVLSVAPVQVSSLVGVDSVVAGGEHSCGLKSDGTVWCWGRSELGQLGDGVNHPLCGAAECSPVPVQTASLVDVAMISAGSNHTCVVVQNTTMCWGRNTNGELGDSTLINRPTPVQPWGLGAVRFVSAGGYHTCAVKFDGTAWCWGLNAFGQLGDGVAHQDCSGMDCSPVPVQVSGLTDVETISAGVGHTCAMKNDGTAWCWGLNGSGQLGAGTTANHALPTAVAGPY